MYAISSVVSSMETSYCDDLWNGFTINKNGDVYCCCHLKPFVVGNIYHNELNELLNTPDMIKHRKKSLKGELECYLACNLVQRNLPHHANESSEVVDYNNLQRLHINFGESCNIRCIMCEHPKRHLEKDVLLDHNALIKNIEISPFDDILLQGGEPLYLSSCIKYMDYLETMNKKYILLTNGLLINKKMAVKLANNASIVSISINAATKETHEKVNIGSNFERVLSNISELMKARKKDRTSLIINGRMTLVPQNVHEIPIFLNEYKKLGFDRINFGFDRATVPQYLLANSDFSTKLKSRIEDVLTHSNLDEIDIMRLKQLGLTGNEDEVLLQLYSQYGEKNS